MILNTKYCSHIVVVETHIHLVLLNFQIRRCNININTKQTQILSVVLNYKLVKVYFYWISVHYYMAWRENKPNKPIHKSFCVLWTTYIAYVMYTINNILF